MNSWSLDDSSVGQGTIVYHEDPVGRAMASAGETQGSRYNECNPEEAVNHEKHREEADGRSEGSKEGSLSCLTFLLPIDL